MALNLPSLPVVLLQETSPGKGTILATVDDDDNISVQIRPSRAKQTRIARTR